ncbi:deoxyguanosinetriphosphate triphosphohydrolase [Klebsiella pneumoniae]|uniref:Deoxyguanosinetriphosphate triphosphohydrolase n=1 Tax=Klebsiella pneumoniae TaxID=573 RepID=A0A377XLN1_KLEPN|nr:deoxyguanosinetriphosphate triphosphohydrolase [Klebsiella pneumoniae]
MRCAVKCARDLCSFEGNAQGIRLVHTLMRMNLTWAQVGCILKYTRPAWWSEETPGQPQLFNEETWLLFSRKKSMSRVLRKELDLRALQSVSINLDYGGCG